MNSGQSDVINLSSIFTAKETLNERKKHSEKEKNISKQISPQRIHLQNLQTAQAAQHQK